MVRRFHGDPGVKKPPCNARHRFDPWSGKMPHVLEQLTVLHNY